MYESVELARATIASMNIRSSDSTLVSLWIFHDEMWRRTTIILIALMARRNNFFFSFSFLFAIWHAWIVSLCLHRERAHSTLHESSFFTIVRSRYCVDEFLAHQQHITFTAWIHPNSRRRLQPFCRLRLDKNRAGDGRGERRISILMHEWKKSVFKCFTLHSFPTSQCLL